MISDNTYSLDTGRKCMFKEGTVSRDFRLISCYLDTNLEL